MEEIGVSTKNIIVDDSYHTSVSHVFIDSYRPYHPLYHSNSDHHTYMFRGATSFITPEIVENYFRTAKIPQTLCNPAKLHWKPHVPEST